VLDMPAEFYLDTIRVVFQDFSLVNGTWQVQGELVKPQDIKTTALLTIEGELDDISGAGQTRAAHGLCTGIDKKRMFHYDAKGAGHYGIFSGRRWREQIYPQVRDFIAGHQKAVTVRGAASKAVSALSDSSASQTLQSAVAPAPKAPRKAAVKAASKTGARAATRSEPKATAPSAAPARARKPATKTRAAQ
jgi:poly(3-hydroxybutyrate) depolymerase